VAAEGFPELLDAADDRSRELIEVAREMQAAARASDTRLKTIEQRLDRKAEADRRRDLLLSVICVFVGLVFIRSAYVMYTSWEGLTLDAVIFFALAVLWCVAVLRWWRRPQPTRKVSQP
jgi:Flp pilus assembly protein TadB